MFDPKPHFWICLGVHLRIFQLEVAGRDNVGHGASCVPAVKFHDALCFFATF